MAGGILAVVQTRAVDEVGVVHAQFLGPLIHPVHEGAFRPGDMLRHGAGAVVGGGHGDGFDHVGDGHGLAHLQIDLAAAFCRRRFRGHHHVVPADPAFLDGLHDQQHGHHLGDAGRCQRFVGVGLKQHRAGFDVHQHRALSPYRQIYRFRGKRRRQKQQTQYRKHCQSPFHNDPLLFRGTTYVVLLGNITWDFSEKEVEREHLLCYYRPTII